ncbi:MAG: hypothetical protein JNK57_05645 [Planctomycetaceae bacterium]|nr:hypothetical protein [Planctomycetaceae bacterium]
MTRSKLLPTVWDIPAYFHGRVGDRPGRQRAMIDNGHLLLILHQPPQRNSKQREPHLFYRKPDGTWHSTADGSGLAALNKHLERFDRLLETLEVQEDQAKTANEYLSLIEEMLPLKRMAANLYATLDDARKGLPQVRELINFRDHAYEISRAADLLFDATTAGAELAQTRHAEAQSRHAQALALSAHRLNLLVAFFFPLATMAAVFGMNLPIGLEDHSAPVPFLIVCAIGFVLGIFLLGLIFKRPEDPDRDK